MQIPTLQRGFAALIVGAFFFSNILSSTPMRATLSIAEAHVQEPAAAQRLEPGIRVEQELSGGQLHRRQFDLGAGQHVRFLIEKQGINLTLTFKDPAGETLFSPAFEELEHGVDAVVLVAKTDGRYTLEIGPNFKKAPPGRYALTMEAPRTASEDDLRRFTAQSAFVEVVGLFNKQSAEARREALKKLSESLPLWRKSEDRVWEARTIFWQGWIHFWLSEFGPSLEFLNQARELRRAARDLGGEAEILRTIAIVLSYRAENQKALERLTEALETQKQQPQRWQRAFTLTELGKIYWRLGDLDKSDQYFDEGLRWFREVGDEGSEVATLTSRSFIYMTQGKLQPALNILVRALPLHRSLNDAYGEAAALNNLGKVYYNLGERAKAVEYFLQSLAVNQKNKFTFNEAQILVNLGIASNGLGEKQKAIGYYDQAQKLMKVVGNPRNEANLLRHLAEVYIDLGQFQDAQTYLNRSLEISRAQQDAMVESAALTNLGEVQAALGDREKAIETLRLALPMRRAIRDRNGVPATLSALARLERDRGKTADARALLEEAIELIETQRAAVVGAELRASYLATHQRYYEQYIDLLMQLHEQAPESGYNVLALQASERARARALLDSLAEARAEIRQGCDPALLEREKSLQKQIGVKEDRRSKTISAKLTAEQKAAADREIDALIAEYQQVQAQIRASSPRYAALTQPQPLGLSEIQAQLDPESLLLVYSLGAERSFLWTVTPTKVKSYALPSEAQLAKSANDFHRQLKTRPHRGSIARTQAAASQIFQWLLGPAAGDLERKRLVIVADGSLATLPFAALLAPGSTRPIIADREIVQLPSISALALLRRELAGRRPAPKTIAVIADPVFEPWDLRIKKRQGADETLGEEHDPIRTATRSAENVGLQYYPRLKHSRDEADRITSLAPADMQSKIVDFAASRETVYSVDLSQYRMLHIATHAVLDKINPELSGLVLSLYNEKGQPQDGFLRAHEIYNLKLAADLVVLSACQTALGKDVRGEGAIGLSRGFMYAGAPRLVVSLWNVDDQATAKLMTLFYQGMLSDRLTPAAALRKAQMEMQKIRAWSAPYFWAGFVLQGEWR